MIHDSKIVIREEDGDTDVTSGCLDSSEYTVLYSTFQAYGLLGVSTWYSEVLVAVLATVP